MQGEEGGIGSIQGQRWQPRGAVAARKGYLGERKQCMHENIEMTVAWLSRDRGVGLAPDTDTSNPWPARWVTSVWMQEFGTPVITNIYHDSIIHNYEGFHNLAPRVKLSLLLPSVSLLPSVTAPLCTTVAMPLLRNKSHCALENVQP